MKISAFVLTLGLVAALPATGGAETAAEINQQVAALNSSTSNHGQTHVIGKISNDFNSFLGADGTAVVRGLRTGTPISLTSTTTVAGGAPITNTTMITPPNGQMGFGNVYISLALAKQQLASLDPPITQPTPQQLQAALTGGTITQTTGTGVNATTTTTNLDGILTMRSAGMGWGEIAQKLNTKLGPVMAGMKSANKTFASAPSASVKTTSGGATVTTGKGNRSSDSNIVSGSGKAHGNAVGAASPGKSSGSGIVSASGKAHGNAYGLNRSSGIVTGSGSAGGNGAVVSAGGGKGNGLAHGKGHDK